MQSEQTVYPPPDHVLSALGIEIAWRNEETLDGRVTVDPALFAGPGQPAGVGSLVPVVDAVAGSCLSRHLDGDWMATADVWLHEQRPLGPGPIELDASVLRAGSRSLVAAVEVCSGGSPAAVATVEFSRIRREASGHRGRPVEPTGEWRRLGSGPLLDRSLDAACGIRVVDPSTGLAEVERTDFVANSIGTLQGGVVAMLADVSAAALVGQGARTIDLQYRFLAQTGVDPARASAEVVRVDADGSVVRVSVVDAADGSLVGFAICRVLRPDQGAS